MGKCPSDLSPDPSKWEVYFHFDVAGTGITLDHPKYIPETTILMLSHHPPEAEFETEADTLDPRSARPSYYSIG
jgi:hypothetical protein